MVLCAKCEKVFFPGPRAQYNPESYPWLHCHHREEKKDCICYDPTWLKSAEGYNFCHYCGRKLDG